MAVEPKVVEGAAGGPAGKQGDRRQAAVPDSVRLRYRRLLIKFSGEVLAGASKCGIDPQRAAAVATGVLELCEHGVQPALVIGGGNFLRGAAAAGVVMERTTADQMGMLATVINALAVRDALERLGLEACLLSALRVGGVEAYCSRRARRSLDAGCVVLCAGGTGNPYFTTDTAAGLRAVEIGAELLVKATKVDGVYADDPVRDPGARRFQRLGYDEALQRRLGVMDATALLMCREHGLAIRVLNMNRSGALLRAARGLDEGTLIDGAEERARA